jgi:hypothetical protein
MADIKVKLSDAGIEAGEVFHDWEFWAPDSNRGASGDIERYTVTNKFGNALFVRVKLLDGEEQLLAVKELEFTLKGGIEHNDFSTFLELVEKAREMHSILEGDRNG